ncbi:hypothetical protein [Ehrlichia ruminantium]|uniref:hypothetical protein n=1 Tax=Ehrlichia ruminantium TaxID=779 RepID=UPI0015DC85D6|nr:hypothetical protein [Ehrlichia ruminantium]QLK56900.1 hypothetical protein FDZ60_02200 [Ehrlichia ruminantium]
MIDLVQNIYTSVLKSLKSHRELNKIVTNIFDITPNNVSLPYLNVHISNFKTLSTFDNNIFKAQILCNIYSNHINVLYKISNLVSHILLNHQINLPTFEYKIIPEYSSTITEHKESIHALLIFTILARKIHVNTITN